jgi:hypothetical protein
MRRRLFTILSVFSLVLCVATVVVWVRSTFHSESFGWAGWKDNTAAEWQGWGVNFDNGKLAAYGFSGTYRFDDPRHLGPSDPKMQPHFVHSRYPPSSLGRSFRWETHRFLNASPSLQIRFVGVPLWFAAVVFALPLTWIVPILVRRRAKSRIGRCRICLYDLTGNVSGVCPECGSKVTA